MGLLKWILIFVVIIIVAYIFFFMGSGTGWDTILSWTHFKASVLSVVG
jgi:hypothetical protein